VATMTPAITGVTDTPTTAPGKAEAAATTTLAAPAKNTEAVKSPANDGVEIN
jgi:hypothetical protein